MKEDSTYSLASKVLFPSDCVISLLVLKWIWKVGTVINTSYTAPANPLLWGNVINSDWTESLLASVCSLRNTKNMTAHDRMFFAKGDYICDENTGLSVVEHNNILSTAFVVPALPSGTKRKCNEFKRNRISHGKHWLLYSITAMRSMEIDWLGYSFKYRGKVTILSCFT